MVSGMPSAPRHIASGVVIGAMLLLAGCSSVAPGPAALDARNDTCAHCRMAVSNVKFAAQLVAPGEEPKFFDDIGCLREHLEGTAKIADGTIAYVASHRSGEWVLAREAFYLKNNSVETPMGFHLLAFESASARDADSAAAGGERLDAVAVFGVLPPAGSTR